MGVFWHVETDFFALAVFIALFFKSRFLSKEKDFQNRAFTVMMAASAVSALIDVLSSEVMNAPQSWGLYQVSMILYALSVPVLAYFWIIYTVFLIFPRNSERAKRLLWLLSIPFALYTLLCVSNPLTSLMFSLSPDLVYTRGPLFYLCGVGTDMLYSLMGIVMVFLYREKIRPKYNTALLMLFYITTAASLWVQLAMPGWLIIHATYAVVFVICDATIEEYRKGMLHVQIRTQNVELEAAVARAEEAARRAEEANAAKTDFLSKMSHEIRTPMNAIIGMTDIAKNSDGDAAQVSDCLDKIDLSAHYLLGLINDILEMSRIESGKVEINHAEFSFDEMMSGVQTIVQPLAKRSRLCCDLEVEPACEGLYFGDGMRIQQVLVNLLSNAIKFTGEGGRVRLSAQKTQNGVQFRVEDTGIGMSTTYLPHLFEAFSQENGGNKTIYGGSGLGLAITKSIVAAMGGTIAVESLEDVGSTFTVQLPLQRLSDEAIAAHPSATVCDADLTGCRVLLAEDHPLNIAVAKRIMERRGVEVTVAENGRRALELFEASEVNAFDIVLMDIRMPEMDGLEATRAIRALSREDAKTVAIIAMTANALDEDRKRSQEAGMDAHLSKPIEPQKLYRTLARFRRQA